MGWIYKVGFSTYITARNDRKRERIGSKSEMKDEEGRYIIITANITFKATCMRILRCSQEEGGGGGGGNVPLFPTKFSLCSLVFLKVIFGIWYSLFPKHSFYLFPCFQIYFPFQVPLFLIILTRHVPLLPGTPPPPRPWGTLNVVYGAGHSCYSDNSMINPSHGIRSSNSEFIVQYLSKE